MDLVQFRDSTECAPRKGRDRSYWGRAHGRGGGALFRARPAEGAGPGRVGAGPRAGPFPRTRSFRSGPGAWPFRGRGGPCQCRGATARALAPVAVGQILPGEVELVEARLLAEVYIQSQIPLQSQ